MPSNGQMERRFLANPSSGLKVRKRDDGRPVVEGYAAVFYRDGEDGTEYKMWDDFVERIMPEAFDRAAKEDDVRGLFNHDPDNLIGRTTAGTMTLAVDTKGLRYEITMPETRIAADVVGMIERGDLTGSSFSFIPTDQTWREVGSTLIREVRGVQLFDVGPVTFPAYSATTTGVRSEDRERMRQEAAEFMRKSAPDYRLKARSQKILADIG